MRPDHRGKQENSIPAPCKSGEIENMRASLTSLFWLPIDVGMLSNNMGHLLIPARCSSPQLDIHRSLRTGLSKGGSVAVVV